MIFRNNRLGVGWRKRKERMIRSRKIGVLVRLIVFRVKLTEKKRERRAQRTDTIVPDTFPVISRSIVCATQVERYKNSTVCSPGRQCASFSPDRVREIEQNCWSQWSSFSFRVWKLLYAREKNARVRAPRKLWWKFA